MRSTPTAGTVAVAAVLLFGAAVWLVPWATRPRDMPASVPSPRALDAIGYVTVAPGSEACGGAVAMEQHSEVALITVYTRRRLGPPLELSVTGAGYRETARLAGGYADGLEHGLVLRPPSDDVLVRACVRNRGRAPALLAASPDRARSRSLAVVDGRRTDRSFWLAFYERDHPSVLDRVPATLERMSTFRPAVVGPWLLWPLLLLVVFGIPAGAIYAWRHALAGERPQPAARTQAPNASPSASGTAKRGTA
jgi:hypothetical protein